MGADTSLPLPSVKPGFSTMCVSFQYTDRITVLHLDDAGLSIIRQAINETWQSGIKLEQTVCVSGWSFKLNGNPFGCSFGETTSSNVSQQARQMVCQILQKLQGNGWKIITSTDLGRQEDKSTMFFKKSSPEFSQYLCVGLSSSDKLQIVNLPPQLVEPMKQIIRLYWSLGIQDEDLPNPGVLEVKLRGNPWWSTDEQSIMAKVLLQNIIATLRSYQWVYCCNVNLNGKADSLIFCCDPNINPGESAQFCTISLNRHDRLRVITAPENIVAMVKKVIQTTWGCIQNERDYHGSWEFKLSGNPWYSSNKESAMARYLVLKILEAMLEQGWHNIAGIDISRRPNDNNRPNDKTVFVFQKKEPKCCPMMCLSLNDVDKFRLINMPNEMIELFKKLLCSRWPKGIQNEQILTLSIGTAYEAKLSGQPWLGGNRNDTVHARSFLCEIIEEFMERGWTLYLSADIAAKYDDYPFDVYSMWFVYDPATSAQSSATTYGFNFATGPTQYGMPSLPYPSTTAVPYPPPTAPEMPAEYGVQPGPHPQPNEPPPSYTQATGWNTYGEKQ